MELDAVDLGLIQALGERSRLSYRELAKQVGVSVATALNRVRRLEQEGVIRASTIRLDYEKLGYDVGVLVQVRVSKGKLFAVEKKIAADPHVTALYDITGSFDAMVVARFKSRRSLDAFLKKVQGYEFVERTETMLILNEMAEKHVRLVP